jgi:dTDP-4-amino-4,6-dideoxygalactose transaminase
MQNMVLSQNAMKVPHINLQAQYATIEKDIRREIDTVLTTQKFILDEQGRAFENEMASLTNSTDAIGCASGTDALLLSLVALGIGPGDEVITTAYSFFATAGMIAWLGARPVFVDIHPDTFNLRADQIASKITQRTKAIIAVDLFGQCCAVERITDYGLPVIEDAAQAIGSTRNGKPAGSFGLCGCFSFFPTKNLGGYGDGGMIVTNDEKFGRKLKMLRSHGQDAERYIHVIVGTNSRLDEIQAAVLRVKLKHLAKWNQKRLSNADFYNSKLRDLPIELPVVKDGNVSNFHQYIIKTKDRDRLKTFLSDEGIATAIHYPIILPLQPCFANLGHRPGDFPYAEKCSETSLALPVHAELSAEQLEFVAFSISRFFQ